MALSAAMQKELPRVRACLAQHPVERAWIFGSFSRGEEREDSDVDFLVNFTPGARVSLFTIARIYRALVNLLGREVDVVEESCLLPYAAETANRDKILIYERKIQGQGLAHELASKARLEHILTACDVITDAMKRYDFEAILADPLLYHGLVKHIEIIGEASYMLSKEFKAEHTEVDWQEMEDMRHILVHDYYRILPSAVKIVAEEDIPALRPKIQGMYENEK